MVFVTEVVITRYIQADDEVEQVSSINRKASEPTKKQIPVCDMLIKLLLFLDFNPESIKFPLQLHSKLF